MHALHELRAFTAVALTTGTRNVDLGNRRLWISRRQDVVTPVTVSANCGGDVALRESFRVHTLAIGKERSITDAASFHD